MTLEPGQRLGAYEITAAIGRGGMGEVYRARDTKLGRDVAIKALPEDFARDPERLARFKREAQVLAALNHPNIAAIHGLEDVDGDPFLVLELVEGEDLAERLARGPIPVDEAIEIAKQVAEALEEAHEKGIIHRDLKPANVKVTPEGVVKVLDFGLAKAFAGEAISDVNMSDSPTMTRNATAAGVVLGTAAYMSPEQAKGKTVDRRADIWAFGATVYEMLTGAKAFAGDDVSETLAAILRDEPNWKRLPSPTPVNVRALLERCLRKNPRERQRDMGDARLELSGPREIVASVPQQSRSALAALAGLVVGALLVGASWMANAPAPPRVTKMVIPLPQGQKLVERLAPPLAVSPDGRTIVYAAETEGAMGLYRRPLESDEAMLIRGTEGGHSPFFSPDGDWLGFFTDTALKKVPAEGGAATTLAPAEKSNLGATWGPDGTLVYSPTAGGGRLLKISQAGGESEAINSPSTPIGPQFLPDGDTVLFRGINDPTLLALSLQSGEIQRREAPDNYIAYVASGHLLHWSGDAVAATPFEALAASGVGGNAAVVVEGVASMTDARVDSNPYLAVSPSGTMAYVSGARREQRLVLVGRDGSVRPLLDGSVHAPRVSPDGRSIAYNTDGVWIFDIDRGSKRLVSPDGGRVTWKYDGRALAAHRERIPHEIPADGSDEGKPLLQSGQQYLVDCWSHDGRFLVLGAFDTPTEDIWVLPIGERPQPYLVTDHNEHAADFSPNDRFIAYVSDESGQQEVYVRPFPMAEGLTKISTNGGAAPVWSRDGTELFYRQGRDLMSVKVETDEEFRAGTPELVLSGDFHADAAGHAGYDVMPDGQSFVMIQENEDAPLTEIHVVLNWFEELNRLVPIE